MALRSLLLLSAPLQGWSQDHYGEYEEYEEYDYLSDEELSDCKAKCERDKPHDPVCADNKSYQNGCQAECDGVFDFTPGPCDSDGAEVECQEVSTRGVDYKGTHQTTISGRVCQEWSATSPHWHVYDKRLGGDSNYCRNPDGRIPGGLESEGVWCYTREQDTQWEYCGVPKCAATTVTPTVAPTEAPTTTEPPTTTTITTTATAVKRSVAPTEAPTTTEPPTTTTTTEPPTTTTITTTATAVTTTTITTTVCLTKQKKKCIFPFEYGEVYRSCTDKYLNKTVHGDVSWCIVENGGWDYCEEKSCGLTIPMPTNSTTATATTITPTTTTTTTTGSTTGDVTAAGPTTARPTTDTLTTAAQTTAAPTTADQQRRQQQLQQLLVQRLRQQRPHQQRLHLHQPRSTFNPPRHPVPGPWIPVHDPQFPRTPVQRQQYQSPQYKRPQYKQPGPGPWSQQYRRQWQQYQSPQYRQQWQQYQPPQNQLPQYQPPPYGHPRYQQQRPYRQGRRY